MSGAQLFINFGNYGPAIVPGSNPYRMLPGAFYGSEQTAPGAARTGVAFSVSTSGAIGYDASERAFRWRALDELAIAAFYAGHHDEGRRAIVKLLHEQLFPPEEGERLRRNAVFYGIADG